jgi:purine-binding chemotaxis protein CheW
MDNALHTKESKILIFTLDELIFALYLSNVIRVIPAMEIRELPKAPDIIKGIINVQGLIIPVVDIRKRFGHSGRKTEIDDRIIIADTGKRKVALFADTVSDIKELESNQFVSSKKSLPFAEYIAGVAKIDNEIILIHDLEEFLSLDEDKGLEEALKANTG